MPSPSSSRLRDQQDAIQHQLLELGAREARLQSQVRSARDPPEHHPPLPPCPPHAHHMRAYVIPPPPPLAASPTAKRVSHLPCSVWFECCHEQSLRRLILEGRPEYPSCQLTSQLCVAHLLTDGRGRGCTSGGGSRPGGAFCTHCAAGHHQGSAWGAGASLGQSCARPRTSPRGGRVCIISARLVATDCKHVCCLVAPGV